ILLCPSPYLGNLRTSADQLCHFSDSDLVRDPDPKEKRSQTAAHDLFFELELELFYGDAFCQIPGLVHIQTADGGDMVSKQLQRQYGHNRGEHPWGLGDPQNVVCHAS